MSKWVKEHKKELITAGIGVGIICASVVAAKNPQILIKADHGFRDVVATASGSAPINMADKVTKIVQIPEHLRTLPTGYSANPMKIEDVVRMGGNPLTQTTVIAHPRVIVSNVA